jgi:uncharacterized protein YqhQ
MTDIINDTEISLLLIKICGLFCIFISSVYLSLTRSSKKFSMHSWKNLATLGLILGLIDAGLSLTFGKMAFVITPVFVISFFGLWIVSKNPLWRFKHLLFLVSSFVICSTVFFYGVAGLFFHLAVEGKF